MAPLKVSDILKASLLIGGAIRKGEAPAADEMADALQFLTFMLHSWGARKLMIRSITEEHFPLTVNIGSYTIGSGGAFNTTKPIKITGGFVRDSGNMDTPLAILTKAEWDAYEDKAISIARPDSLYYDPGAAQQTTQLGTVHLYCIPDGSSTYNLYINSTKLFTDYANINANLTFEPPYELAIVYELAILLWRQYHKASVPVPRDVYEIANEAMHTVEAMNATRVVAKTDLPGQKTGVYNIYTGDYNNG
jgi:hypothetical protein